MNFHFQLTLLQFSYNSIATSKQQQQQICRRKKIETVKLVFYFIRRFSLSIAIGIEYYYVDRQLFGFSALILLKKIISFFFRSMEWNWQNTRSNYLNNLIWAIAFKSNFPCHRMQIWIFRTFIYLVVFRYRSKQRRLIWICHWILSKCNFLILDSGIEFASVWYIWMYVNPSQQRQIALPNNAILSINGFKTICTMYHV